METSSLGAVPVGCRDRLTKHYGPAAGVWLDVVPYLLDQAATRWGLDLVGYHDAGHSSVLAVVNSRAGRPMLLKAWYDRTRYVHETVALARWDSPAAARLLATAPDLAVAAMELVGGRPGGATPASDEYHAVAAGIGRLHATRADPARLPSLADYLAREVMPRVDWRTQRLGADIPERCLDALARVYPDEHQIVLLHGDLYRENVAFDETGRPVFVDPLPMVGDPLFDWAFWVVYYTTGDQLGRLPVAVKAAGVAVADLLPWCLMLCVDGLLYYRDSGDSRAPHMLQMMHTLATLDREAAPC
jgi:streptomycin 6-kinase